MYNNITQQGNLPRLNGHKNQGFLRIFMQPGSSEDSSLLPRSTINPLTDSG